MVPTPGTPTLGPCAPSSTTRDFGWWERWLPCNPLVPRGAAGPFGGLWGGHALLLYHGGVDTHPMNPLPLSHLSRALGCISRFQEQLRHFLGSSVSPAVQDTVPDTVPSQYPPGDHPLIMAMYNTMG